MDDFRDLMAAMFALVCAALMLIAGELFLQYGTRANPLQDTIPTVRDDSPPPEAPIPGS